MTYKHMTSISHYSVAGNSHDEFEIAFRKQPYSAFPSKSVFLLLLLQAHAYPSSL